MSEPSQRSMEKALEIMSGLPLWKFIDDDVDADVVEAVTMTFAALLDAVRAEERERCAKVCDDAANKQRGDVDVWMAAAVLGTARECAAAIRRQP